jgi:hypothetical protein
MPRRPNAGRQSQALVVPPFTIDLAIIIPISTARGIDDTLPT